MTVLMISSFLAKCADGTASQDHLCALSFTLSEKGGGQWMRIFRVRTWVLHHLWMRSLQTSFELNWRMCTTAPTERKLSLTTLPILTISIGEHCELGKDHDFARQLTERWAAFRRHFKWCSFIIVRHVHRVIITEWRFNTKPAARRTAARGHRCSWLTFTATLKYTVTSVPGGNNVIHNAKTSRQLSKFTNQINTDIMGPLCMQVSVKLSHEWVCPNTWDSS